MLVHICCSVDSFYYLEKLKERYPEEPLTGYFYDPNIHPYSEYYLRMIDAKRSCDLLGISFIEGEYDVECWLNAVRGLEEAPEKGERCNVCFDTRLERTVQKAKEVGEESITTTLLMSPKKEMALLTDIGTRLAEAAGLRFIAEDFRSGGGTQAQFAMSREYQAYHQNYCGCQFALDKQRKAQGRDAAELFSPLDRRVLPGSIEERVALYTKRLVLDEAGTPYRIERQRFYNYRLLWGKVEIEKEVVPSIITDYSVISGRQVKGVLEPGGAPGLFRLNRQEVLVATDEWARNILGSVPDMVCGIAPEAHYALREAAGLGAFSLGALVVVPEANPGQNVAVAFQEMRFEEHRERLVPLK